MTTGEPEGIMINLISIEKLSDMSPGERIRFIVDEVKKGKVLVLERGLTAVEEMELIKITMAEIDNKSFVGVETPGFSISARKRTLWDRLRRKSAPPRMMVVGPAQLLRTIRKDGKVVQAMLLAKDRLRPMRHEEVEGTSEISMEAEEGIELEGKPEPGIGTGGKPEPVPPPLDRAPQAPGVEPPPPPVDMSPSDPEGNTGPGKPLETDKYPLM